MYTRLVESTRKRKTADGGRGLRLRWRWRRDVDAGARKLACERIAAWLERNTFGRYTFTSHDTSEQLRVAGGAELARWARPIASNVSLFLGDERQGPLRFGIVG